MFDLNKDYGDAYDIGGFEGSIRLEDKSLGKTS